MAGGGQLRQAGVHVRADGRIRPGRAVESDPDEDAVVAVGRRGGERLAVDRHDADAVFAGALGDELLHPRPEGRQLAVDDEGQLVAPVLREDAHGQAQRQAGVLRRVGLAAGDDHLPGLLEQLVQVDARAARPGRGRRRSGRSSGRRRPAG